MEEANRKRLRAISSASIRSKCLSDEDEIVLPIPGSYVLAAGVKQKNMEAKKYRLTENHINIGNRILYQIEALKDFGDVKAGDLGGHIESEKNLAQENSAWVYDDAKVYGNAKVCDDASIYGNARVCDDAEVYGDACVYDNDGNIMVYFLPKIVE